MVRQAVILVGGAGTRLGSLTANTPKPMIDVAGRPFLDYILDGIGSQGFTHILLLTGYRSDDIAKRYEATLWRGAKVQCVAETSPLGTGGALLNAAAFLDERFVMMNGDTLFDINLNALVNESEKHDGIATLALRPASGDRYGAVEWDGERIRSFASRGQGRYINGGIYVLDKAILSYITKTPASIEADIFPVLVQKGLLHGRSFDNFFLDIGIPEALAAAQHSIPAQLRRPAVFFDRDGVLNIDKGYVHTKEGFEWREGAMKAIRYLNDNGWWVMVVTNQAGVARGYYDEKHVHSLHRWMNDELAAHGAHIHAFYHCPHHPEGKVTELATSCDCRKPEPGMLVQAMEEWAIDKGRSFLIGDKESDIAAARAAGVEGILLRPEERLLDVVRNTTAMATARIVA